MDSKLQTSLMNGRYAYTWYVWQTKYAAIIIYKYSCSKNVVDYIIGYFWNDKYILRLDFV